jgi:succinyl-CoA synthetase beta subunit
VIFCAFLAKSYGARGLCRSRRRPHRTFGTEERGPRPPRRELDGPLWVVKAQIHAGGRGKGHVQGSRRGRQGRRAPRQIRRGGRGGSQEDAGPHAGDAPDRPRGKQVNRIYIEDGSGIERELYLALLVDRQSSRVSFVCSTEGGMDIEEVAASTPEKILSFASIPPPAISPSTAAASPSRSGSRASRSSNAWR